MDLKYFHLYQKHFQSIARAYLGFNKTKINDLDDLRQMNTFLLYINTSKQQHAIVIIFEISLQSF